MTSGDRAQQRLRWVILGLLFLALLAAISTVVFWRLTRPSERDDSPSMRPAAPAEVAAAALLLDAPITEPHPVVTVPAGPLGDPSVPPPVVAPAPAMNPEVPPVLSSPALAPAIVPTEILDPSVEFEAEDASVPTPPSTPPAGMWASSGWGAADDGSVDGNGQ
ncbi:MAG: hypothetical protein ACKOYM_02285 [Actinomycetes bacterium]